MFPWSSCILTVKITTVNTNVEIKLQNLVWTWWCLSYIQCSVGTTYFDNGVSKRIFTSKQTLETFQLTHQIWSFISTNAIFIRWCWIKSLTIIRIFYMAVKNLVLVILIVQFMLFIPTTEHPTRSLQTYQQNCYLSIPLQVYICDFCQLLTLLEVLHLVVKKWLFILTKGLLS